MLRNRNRFISRASVEERSRAIPRQQTENRSTEIIIIIIINRNRCCINEQKKIRLMAVSTRETFSTLTKTSTIAMDNSDQPQDASALSDSELPCNCQQWASPPELAIEQGSAAP